jgi:hypothetical protein
MHKAVDTKRKKREGKKKKKADDSNNMQQHWSKRSVKRGEKRQHYLAAEKA